MLRCSSRRSTACSIGCSARRSGEAELGCARGPDEPEQPCGSGAELGAELGAGDERFEARALRNLRAHLDEPASFALARRRYSLPLVQRLITEPASGWTDLRSPTLRVPVSWVSTPWNSTSRVPTPRVLTPRGLKGTSAVPARAGSGATVPSSSQSAAHPHGRWVAERVGFEPTEPVRAHRLSKAAHSATLPPLRTGGEDSDRRRLWLR